jgi:TorA maturation chaperone TorD
MRTGDIMTMGSNTVNDLESIKTVYLFLAGLYLKEVDAELLGQFRSEDFIPLLREAGIELPESDSTDDELLEELSSEYTALFITPGSMPPYQSVSESGRFLADAADRTELFYQKCGFDYRKEYPKLFPDHIGIQFSFMASLLEGEIRELKEKNFHKANEVSSSRSKFFQEHLGKWYASYFDRLLDGVEHPFYKSVAEFTRAFLDNEADVLASTIT